MTASTVHQSLSFCLAVPESMFEVVMKFKSFLLATTLLPLFVVQSYGIIIPISHVSQHTNQRYTHNYCEFLTSLPFRMALVFIVKHECLVMHQYLCLLI
jgi:hypothetical protein